MSHDIRGRLMPRVGVPGLVEDRVPAAGEALERGVERPSGALFVGGTVEQQLARGDAGRRGQGFYLGRVRHCDRRAGGGQHVEPRVGYLERLKRDSQAGSTVLRLDLAGP